MNLNQITIKSSDVSRAVTFYQTLGLRLIVDSSPRYVRFESPNGDSTFSVSHCEAVTDLSTTVYFEVDDLDQAYQQLKAQGMVFNAAPEDQDWLWRETSLSDPDGHPLVLYNAGNHRKNPPWRLSARQAEVKKWYQILSEMPFNILK